MFRRKVNYFNGFTVMSVDELFFVNGGYSYGASSSITYSIEPASPQGPKISIKSILNGLKDIGMDFIITLAGAAAEGSIPECGPNPNPIPYIKGNQC